MKESARGYYDLGCNIVVLNGDKEPLVKWEKWQNQRQTLEEFEALPWSQAKAYAVIMGAKLTNGLYMGAIDIDVKKVTEETIDRGNELKRYLVTTQRERTRNKGEHWIYYSRQPVQSLNTPSIHDYCGCEVFGEKRYLIMSPSFGYQTMNDNTPSTVESVNSMFEDALKRIGYKDESMPQAPIVVTPTAIRPCFTKMMEKPHLAHAEKIALVMEYYHAGHSQEQIEELFKQHQSWEPGPNHAFNAEKTRYMIDHAIKKPYKRFSCKRIRKEGDCIEGCTYVPQKPKNPFFSEEGMFQPVVFAKALLEKHHFKTMIDNETVFIFDDTIGIYKPLGEIIIKQDMVSMLDDETRHRYYADVLFYVQGATYLNRPHNPENHLAVENGILDITTREIKPFNPEYFITTSLPIKYDKTQNCPKIKKFLEDVVGANQVSLVQEMIGYCLLKAMPIHKAVMLIGDGSNGKSTLLELIKHFLGQDNVSNASLQALCYNRFSIAQLYGKLANIYADLPSTALAQTGTFKMLTGNDTISAEEKFKQPFSFKNIAKMIYSTNRVPETLDDTTAFFRRWLLIVCNNVFLGEKRNPNILAEITTPEELSGLLNYALEGLERLLKNGSFSTTENLDDLRSEYIRKSNSAKAFIEETLVHDTDANSFITTEELYAAYVIYCQTNNLPSMPKRSLTLNMQQCLPQVKQEQKRIKGKVRRVWQYVKNVTAVTPPLLNHKLHGNFDSGNVTGVTEQSEKIPCKECLNEAAVTAVTPEQKEPFFYACYFCGQPIYEDNAIMDEFTAHKPAHPTCYADLKSKTKQAVRG